MSSHRAPLRLDGKQNPQYRSGPRKSHSHRASQYAPRWRGRCSSSLPTSSRTTGQGRKTPALSGPPIIALSAAGHCPRTAHRWCSARPSSGCRCSHRDRESAVGPPGRPHPGILDNAPVPVVNPVLPSALNAHEHDRNGRCQPPADQSESRTTRGHRKPSSIILKDYRSIIPNIRPDSKRIARVRVIKPSESLDLGRAGKSDWPTPVSIKKSLHGACNFRFLRWSSYFSMTSFLSTVAMKLTSGPFNASTIILSGFSAAYRASQSLTFCLTLSSHGLPASLNKRSIIFDHL